MQTVFQRLDPHVGECIDAEQLVKELLSHDLPCKKWPKASIRSEITPEVNALADNLLVIYDTGPATSIGYGRFRFTVSIYAICNDPDKGSEFIRWLYGKVTEWPYQDPQPEAGGIADVKPTGFIRYGPDEWNLARDQHVWSMQDCLITAGIHNR
ncbi:MAG: hypothetical protein J6575_03480 [Bifidobacterium sp.]|nr:hypothetical protein [Bifidobacterium sp.]